MREIIQYLIRRSAFITFLFLLSISFYLIVNFNNNQRDIFEYNINIAANYIESKRNGVAEFFRLKKLNQQIAEENAALMNELNTKAYSLPEQAHKPEFQFEFLACNVIYNSISNAQNYLIINKGEDDGVEVNDGVINQSGVVGQVIGVSKNYCKIMSVLHRDIKINAIVENFEYFGYIKWEPYNFKEAQLLGIPKHASVSLGNKVVVGNSLNFPHSHPIGVIKEIELVPGDNFYTISLDLSADFSELYQVYIVKNESKDELKYLRQENNE